MNFGAAILYWSFDWPSAPRAHVAEDDEDDDDVHDEEEPPGVGADGELHSGPWGLGPCTGGKPIMILHLPPSSRLTSYRSDVLV